MADACETERHRVEEIAGLAKIRRADLHHDFTDGHDVRRHKVKGQSAERELSMQRYGLVLHQLFHRRDERPRVVSLPMS